MTPISAVKEGLVRAHLEALSNEVNRALDARNVIVQ